MAQNSTRPAPPWDFTGQPDRPAPAPTAPASGARQWDFRDQPDRPAPILVNNDLKSQIGRQIYASIPGITATAGTALASAPFLLGAPWTAGASTLAAPTAGLVGAGAGGMVGRGIQWMIDQILDRPAPLQNPASAGQEATTQMLYEAGGQVVATPFRMLRGSAAPFTHEAAERQATNRDFGLGLSTPEITGGSTGARLQRMGARGYAGNAVQQHAREQSQQAASRAITGMLDTLGPAATANEAGGMVQEAVQATAARAGRRVEGALATMIAPKAGTAETGRTTAAGVQAARRGFSQVQQQFNQIVAEGPDVDIRALKSQALSIFHDQIMPALQTVPDFGPNTATFAKLQALYAAGNIVELGTETQKLLNSEALKASTSPAIKTIRRVLTAQDLQPFNAATKLRTALREAGKAPDELLGSEAKGIATTLATSLRGILAEAHPAWDAAAQAYGTDARVFQTRFLRNLIGKDPEAVLTAVGGKSGQVNATRVQQLRRALLDIAAQSPNEADKAAGEQAWNTLRAEWFRRNVFQDDVFGLSDRMGKVDPAVLRAWFPDAPGRQVVARAQQAASQFENQLLRQIADADPARVLDMVGATPQRVRQLRQALTAAPRGTQQWDRMRRAWVEQSLTANPEKLADRIAKTDPDLLQAWFPTPQDQRALTNLRRIGSALAAQQPISRGGRLYENVEATTVVGAFLTGNPMHAFRIALAFEGVPAFLSWAVYQPQIQRYVLDAATPTLPITTRTAALLRAAHAWRSAQTAEAQTPPQQPDDPLQATPAPAAQ